MSKLAKWTIKDLQYMNTQGYSIVKCKNEDEALHYKDILRVNRRCAQAGFIYNNKQEKVYFVLTKHRNPMNK